MANLNLNLNLTNLNLANLNLAAVSVWRAAPTRGRGLTRVHTLLATAEWGHRVGPHQTTSRSKNHSQRLLSGRISALCESGARVGLYPCYQEQRQVVAAAASSTAFAFKLRTPPLLLHSQHLRRPGQLFSDRQQLMQDGLAGWEQGDNWRRVTSSVEQ